MGLGNIFNAGNSLPQSPFKYPRTTNTITLASVLYNKSRFAAAFIVTFMRM
jgi:hypothetical protein